MALVQTTDSTPLAVPGEQAGGVLSRSVARHGPILLLGLFMLLLPIIANDFFLRQFAGWTMILGMISLSLMFLAGYGGMVSLAQMTIAGFAGYMVAIFGVNGGGSVSLGWPWWLAAPMAIALATLFGAITGALAVRTEGIYTIMITLAIASAFFY